MKALKVMFTDGSVIAYMLIEPKVVAAQMIEMSDEDYATFDSPEKPDAQRLFKNEGHLTVSGAR